MKNIRRNRNGTGNLSSVDLLEPRWLLSAAVTGQIPNASVTLGQTPAALTLSSYFDDSEVPAGDTVIDLQPDLAAPYTSIPIVLTNAATPQTVANFLKYISTGEYANTIIHRSIPGFVIQGGGYDTDGTQITSFGSIPGESATATLKNTTGTIAMALTSEGPNTGTSEWFINLADNSDLDDTSDGGPFTAFGQVIDNGMTTVNQIGSLPTVNDTDNGAWTNLPVQNVSSSDNGDMASDVPASDMVVLNPVVVTNILTYTVTSDTPAVATGAISNGQLAISPVGAGTAHFTVTATDLGGGTASSTFSVMVAPSTSQSQSVPSATSLTPTADTFVVGQTNTMNIHVAPATGTSPIPTGSVSLYEDGALQGTYNLDSNGNATASLSVSAANPATVFDAVYNGDSVYASSTSSNVTLDYLPAAAEQLALSKISLPSTAVPGAKFSAKTTAVITNPGASTLSGKFSVVLYADADSTGLGANPVQLATSTKKLTIKSGKTGSIAFNIKSLPISMPAGTYHLVAKLTDPQSQSALATTTQTTAVSVPEIDLSGTFSKNPVVVKSGKKTKVTITVTNSSTANINAIGKQPIVLYASPDQNLSDGTEVGTLNAPINIKPGGSKKISVPVTVTGSADQYLFATLEVEATVFPGDDNLSNNTFDVPLTISGS